MDDLPNIKKPNKPSGEALAQHNTHTHTHIYDEASIKRRDERDDNRNFWKKIAAYAYITICVFDFIIAPSFIGKTKEDLGTLITSLKGLDSSVQMKVLDLERRQWAPLTLTAGGLFHIAMGALLTGVAVTGHKGGLGKKL